MCLAPPPRERRSVDFSPQACWWAKEALEFCGRVCAMLAFLRDESRALAAILVGALNPYDAGSTFERHHASQLHQASSSAGGR